MSGKDKDKGKKMSEKDKGKGDIPGGSKVGEKIKLKINLKKLKKNWAIQKMPGMMMMPEILQNMLVMEEMSVEVKQGGDDYIISADGVAVIHGVRMVPFHRNVPALIG